LKDKSFKFIKKDMVIYMQQYNRWAGKKMNALGDSLTEADISGIGDMGTPWTAYMQKLCGFEMCRNYGICGDFLSGKGGMAERYQAMDNDADIICVFGGTNDFWVSSPLGDKDDSDISTFYGALDTLIKGLAVKYPYAEIFFVTPPKFRSTLYGWETFKQNANGNILKDFRDAIVEIADYYSLPVLDLYTNCGMSCYLDTGIFRPDGLHFSNEGYKRIAYRIAGFVNNL